MEIFNRKKHWENIYQTKELKDVSWFQPTPETSLDFLKQFSVLTSANIIDIGGGDSFLVDHLLNLGYQNISVLDISSTAIDKAKERLGERANKVKWIVADAATFKPTEKYDFWHDRAAFHFLTDEQEISNYLETAQQNINPTGVLVIGTFSEQGPKKCSGIEIKQYSETTMTDRLKKFFEKIKCVMVEHKTPSDTIQNFVFCSFRKTATVYNCNQVELNSTITCPNCGHKKTEIMPTDACVYFYECENCKTRLKPLQGDCCIYCSYGTVKCPSIQVGTSCC